MIYDLLTRLARTVGSAYEGLLTVFGTPVFRMFDVSSARMDAWVGTIRRHSGQPVDWYPVDGHYVEIFALGDIEKVRETIRHHIHACPGRNGRGEFVEGGILIPYPEYKRPENWDCIF